MEEKNVNIRIEGVQKSVSDEPVVQECEGTCTEMNGSWFVRYEEKNEEGSRIKCLIKISDDSVMVRKSGRTVNVLTYEKNKMITCAYSTPYGEMELELTTKDIFIENTKGGMAVRILYSMTANGTSIPECELKISVQGII